MALFNLARMTVSSTGTGTVTLNAAVPGFLTFDLAGCSTASVGQVVTYAISDTTQSEIGGGTYYSSALALTRTPVQSTNTNAAIAMSNAAQVFITPQAKGIIGRVNIQVFNATATYTATTGLIVAVVESIGGGGGGGGVVGSTGYTICGGGGGSGGYSRSVVTAAAIGATAAVTIGGGGAGGAAGAHDGTAGSDTTVGAICTGKGGAGGSFGSATNNPAGGAGGVAGTGDLTIIGQAGAFGWLDTAATNTAPTGAGGGSMLGPGAPSNYTNAATVTGVNGTANMGGGGSGGGASNTALTAAGGNGGSGKAIITEFCSL